MASKNPYFIMIDGPDGVGKGTLAAAAASFLASKGKILFDLNKWWQKNSWHPSISEVLGRQANVLVSAEPTYVGLGREIRNELISEDAARMGRKYTAEQTAQAFALDRAILYQAIIIPALRAGLTVLQERGFPTSLVYQPLQAKMRGEDLTIDYVKKITGNQFAMKHPPNLLIVPTLNADEARARMVQRADMDILESARMLQMDVRKFYSSAEFKEIFEKLGTEVVYVDASGTPQETASRAITMMDEHLRKAGVFEGSEQKPQASLLNFG